MPRVYVRDLHEDGCKTCPRCGERKTIDNFGFSSKAWDHLLGYCRDCQKEKRLDPEFVEKERQRQRGERYRIAVNRRKERADAKAKDTERKQKFIKSGRATEGWRKDRAKHPEHYAARKAVKDAVKRGELRPIAECDCSCAGDGKCTSRMQYHHYRGYERNHWLDVIPVCSYHHGVLHRKFKDENPSFS